MAQDRSAARTSTRGLGALLQVPGLPDLPLPALLRYSAADPAVVRLVLLLDPEAGGPESVEWRLPRALLTAGLRAPAVAEGVRVSAEGRDVAVALPARTTVVLPLAGVVELLADSYALVPTGTEQEPARDLDDALRRLAEGPLDQTE